MFDFASLFDQASRLDIANQLAQFGPPPPDFLQQLEGAGQQFTLGGAVNPAGIAPPGVDPRLGEMLRGQGGAGGFGVDLPGYIGRQANLQPPDQTQTPSVQLPAVGGGFNPVPSQLPQVAQGPGVQLPQLPQFPTAPDVTPQIAQDPNAQQNNRLGAMLQALSGLKRPEDKKYPAAPSVSLSGLGRANDVKPVVALPNTQVGGAPSLGALLAGFRR